MYYFFMALVDLFKTNSPWTPPLRIADCAHQCVHVHPNLGAIERETVRARQICTRKPAGVKSYTTQKHSVKCYFAS